MATRSCGEYECSVGQHIVLTPPPPCSATGAFGPLCGAVVSGQYYFNSISRTLEACPEKDEEDEAWTTAILVVVFLCIAAVVSAVKDMLDAFL